MVGKEKHAAAKQVIERVFSTPPGERVHLGVELLSDSALKMGISAKRAAPE